MISQTRKDGFTNDIEGTRYVDDLTCFIFFDPASPEDKQRAERIAHRIQFGYHKNMELEVEDTDEPFRFLSSMLHVNKNNFNIDAKFYNKNQIQIDSKKPQIFPTYQHFTSYAPMRQKLAVAISAIHRVGNACNSTQGVQEAFDTLRRELEFLKYPTQIIRRALWRVRNTDSRWCEISLPKAKRGTRESKESAPRGPHCPLPEWYPRRPGGSKTKS